MIRPPIVGVPALPWCPAGPSSRICCPNSFARRNSMNFGPRNMHRRSEAMPAIRMAPSTGCLAPRSRFGPDWVDDALETGGARALNENAVTRLGELVEQGSRLFGGRD